MECANISFCVHVLRKCADDKANLIIMYCRLWP